MSRARQPAQDGQTEDRHPAPAVPPAEARAPKPYRAPRLTRYGRLAELTEFGGSQVVDSGAGLGQLP